MSTYVQCRVGAQLGAGGKIAQFRLIGELSAPTVLTQPQLETLANDLALDVDGHKTLWTADVKTLSVACQGFVLAPHTPTPENPALWSIVPDTINQGNTTPVIGDGTAAGTGLPPQNAVVVTLRTASAGRRNRGRVYGFPPPESAVDGAGTITGHDLKGLIDDLISNIDGHVMGAATLEAVVLSLMDGDAEPIVSTDQGGRIDTQRRRLPRSPR